VAWLPTLSASPLFSDADAGDVYTQSQWQVATSNTFLASEIIEDSSIVTSSTYTLTTLLQPATTYYWRVRVADGVGDWSDYSTSTYFTTVENTAPDPPRNFSPTDGAMDVPVQPLLESSIFSDVNIPDGDYHQASQWQITRWLDGNNQPIYTNYPIIDSGTDNTALTSYTPPALRPETTYYWRVRHQDAYGGISEYSTVSSFTTAADSSFVLSHYHIEFDPNTASTEADFRLVFAPHTTDEQLTSGATQLLFEAYVYSATSGNWDQPASGDLQMVDPTQGNNGYDSNGLPYLINPIIDVSTAKRYAVRLRYDQQEQIKIKLVDAYGIESALSDVITVGSPYQIINSDFQDADGVLNISNSELYNVYTGWFTYPDEGGDGYLDDMQILSGSIPCGANSYRVYGNINYGWGAMFSEVFNLKQDTITFCYNHPAGSGYVALLSAADDSVIVADSGSGGTVYWNVSNYVGKGVYIKIQDKHTWQGSNKSISADDFRYYDPLDHYHIDFDPDVASTSADFHITFTPHTSGEVTRFGGSQVQINAYVYSATSGNWNQPASGNLGLVTGYDQNGPILADPVVDASATAGQVTIELRYDIQEQIKLQLVDENTVISSLTDVISVGPPDQIVNHSFEIADLSGWTTTGTSGIYSGSYLACQDGVHVGGGGSSTGTVRSNAFMVTGKEIAFCYGYNQYGNGNHYIALYLAADDTLIHSVKVPYTGQKTFADTAYWNVADYMGQDVYLVIKDGTSNWTGDNFFADNFRYADVPAPGNVSPTDGATGVILTPTLIASAFDPGNAGGTHQASEWQVSSADSGITTFENNLVYTKITASDLTSHTLAESLNVNTTYYWRVRYQNSFSTWSEYSVITSFTTVTSNTPPDTPYNISPADEAQKVINLPLLESSIFSDADSGDTHWKSRWQISTADSGVSTFEANIVYDSVSLHGATDQLLSFWRRSWDDTGKTAELWVKLPSLAANDDTTIYLYGGNPSAADASGFDDTFTKITDTTVNSCQLLWHFDDGSPSSTAADSSGNGYDGTLANGPTWQGSDGGQWDSEASVVFSAGDHLKFNGSNSYVELSGSSALHNGRYTIEAWAYPTSLNSGYERCIAMDVNSYTFYLALSDRTAVYGSKGYGIGWYSGGWKGVATNDNPANYLNQWTHVVGTYDGGTFKIYINGELKNSANYTLSGSSGTLTRVGYYKSTSPQPWDGYIDEVAIYDRVLSQEEIQAHYYRRKFASPQPSTTVSAEETNGSPWLSGWSTRWPVTISEGSGNALTDHQVGSIIIQGNDPGAPNYVDFSVFQSGGIDARFVLHPSARVTHRLNSALFPATTYYWRVRHQDDKGGWSAYSTPTSFTTESLDPDTVALWHLDEAEGTIAYDYSGNNYHGTLTNSPVWTSNAHTGSALIFDGTAALVEQAYSPLYTTGNNFSYELWFSTTTITSGSLLAAVGENGANDAALQININNTGNQ
jgi:hypothetical protein